MIPKANSVLSSSDRVNERNGDGHMRVTTSGTLCRQEHGCFQIWAISAPKRRFSWMQQSQVRAQCGGFASKVQNVNHDSWATNLLFMIVLLINSMEGMTYTIVKFYRSILTDFNLNCVFIY